jgi:lipopolysaccharide export system protein LptA
MSRGALFQNSIFVFVIVVFFLFVVSSSYSVLGLYADAYLSEDKVYYGADSYKVNYKDEIIDAKGNAYFRREGISVRAREITIYYGAEKKALFRNDVRIRDLEQNYELRGDYGEAYFSRDYYFLKGNVSFSEGERVVTAGRWESTERESHKFSDGVRFNDGEVIISSRNLEIRLERTAFFSEDVHAVFAESGDSLFCRELTHHFQTGDSEFRGNVIFLQESSGEEDQQPFVVKSENAQFYKERDLFLLMDDVYVTNGTYSLTAPMVKYFRDRRVIESLGETVINNGPRTVYCDRMELDLEQKKIAFFGTVRGVFNLD